MEVLGAKVRVCVTGAGGFVASWLVKLLLSKGYLVHGTVRDPSDEKNSHLKKLEKAKENLQLFKADLLNYNYIASAIAGCKGVFHVASPVPSCKVANPENWYALCKTQAECEAIDYGKKHGLDVITLCPSFVIGPLLQSTVNATSLFLVNLLKGHKSVENRSTNFVDVRDVADALLLVYEKPEASGRYLCAPHGFSVREVFEILKSKYPHYCCPKEYTEGEYIGPMSSEKLKKLGLKFRAFEESVIECVAYYTEAGMLGNN